MYRNETIPCIAVTNRHLAEGDYLKQIKKMVRQKPESIILREKDLTDEEYEKLAEQVIAIGKEGGVKVFLHSHLCVAKGLAFPNIHLPFVILQNMTEKEKNLFQEIGVSVHSVKEAQDAERLGAKRLLAGHIFSTACKPGLPPRGLGFLEEICRSVEIPVYAIGGITKENAPDCIRAGAKGVCMMSEFMKN